MNAYLLHRVSLRVIAAASALAAATPALAQGLVQGGGPEISWLRVAGALLFCLALAVAAALALRFRMRGSVSFKGVGARRLRLIESLRVTQHASLCLVEVDGRELLYAATAQGGCFHALAPLPAPEAGA